MYTPFLNQFSSAELKYQQKYIIQFPLSRSWPGMANLSIEFGGQVLADLCKCLQRRGLSLVGGGPIIEFS